MNFTKFLSYNSYRINAHLHYRPLFHADVMMEHQHALWEDTISTDADIILHNEPQPVDPKMMHAIQIILSRLVAKAPLIGNFTTNLAEAWMHVRSKFDGGKVINHSQSGSWELRCYGAGLQHNLGKEWGPKLWGELTASIMTLTFSPHSPLTLTSQGIYIPLTMAEFAVCFCHSDLWR